MQSILQKGVVILLWYLGIFNPFPAPEGWQTLRGGDLALHLPPEWEEIRVGAPPGVDPVAGYRPLHQFAPPNPEHRGDMSLILGIAPIGRIRAADKQALYALQVDRPREFAAELQKSVPGRICSVVSTVYDDARHRLWFRFEAQQKDHPPSAVVVVFLTRSAAIYLEGIAPSEDDDFTDTFQDIVNSFEIPADLRLREPAGRLGTNPISSFRLGFEVGQDFGRRNPKLFIAFFLLPMTISTLVGLLLSFDPLLFRRRLKAALIQRLQRSPSRWRIRDSVEPPRSRVRFWQLPLPWALASQIALAFLVAFWMVPRYLRSPQLYGIRFCGVCYLVGYALAGAALALHYIPRTSRHLKYELLATSISVLAIPGTLGDPLLQMGIVGVDLPDLSAFYCGDFLSQTGYFLLSGVIVGSLLRSRGGAAARRASTLYRLTYRFKVVPLILVSLVSWLPAGGFLGGAFALLAAAYLIGEKARENPILYLRSFQDHDTDRVLAKIVMPTAGRFAPVLAFAHELQPPQELYRRTNLLTAAQLTTFPDADWQEGILAILPRCRAVLIDVSVETGGVLWELENARAVLPSERIAVLAQEGDRPLDFPGILVLRYRFGWRGQRAARKALRGWLKRLPPASLPGEAAGVASLSAAPRPSGSA